MSNIEFKYLNNCGNITLINNNAFLHSQIYKLISDCEPEFRNYYKVYKIGDKTITVVEPQLYKSRRRKNNKILFSKTNCYQVFVINTDGNVWYDAIIFKHIDPYRYILNIFKYFGVDMSYLNTFNYTDEFNPIIINNLEKTYKSLTIRDLFILMAHIDKNNHQLDDVLNSFLYFIKSIFISQLSDFLNIDKYFNIISGDVIFDSFFSKWINEQFDLKAIYDDEYLEDDILYFLDESYNIIDTYKKEVLTVDLDYDLLSFNKNKINKYGKFILKGSNEFIIQFVKNSIHRFNPSAEVECAELNNIYNDYISFFQTYNTEDKLKINENLGLELLYIDMDVLKAHFESLKFESRKQYNFTPINNWYDIQKYYTLLNDDNLTSAIYRENLDTTAYYNNTLNIIKILSEVIENKNKFNMTLLVLEKTFSFWIEKSIYDFVIYLKILDVIKSYIIYHYNEQKNIKIVDSIIALSIESFYSILPLYTVEEKKLADIHLKYIHELYTSVINEKHNVVSLDEYEAFTKYLSINNLLNIIRASIGISLTHKNLYGPRFEIHARITEQNPSTLEVDSLTIKQYTMTFLLYEITRDFVWKNGWTDNNIYIEYMLNFIETEIDKYITANKTFNNAIYHRTLSLISAKNNVGFKYYLKDDAMSKHILNKYNSELNFIMDNKYHMVGPTTISKSLDELAKLKYFKNIKNERFEIFDKYNTNLDIYNRMISFDFTLYKNNKYFGNIIDVEERQRAFVEYRAYYAELARGYETFTQILRHKNYDINTNTNSYTNLLKTWESFIMFYKDEKIYKIKDDLNFNIDDGLDFIY